MKMLLTQPTGRPKHWMVAVLAAALVAIGIGTLLLAVRDHHNQPQSRLIWSDDFDGQAGVAPSPSKWNLDIGNDDWGNNEWEYYTDRPANAQTDGAGNLHITARRPDTESGHHCVAGPCNITSARIQTDGTFDATYGRFEARLKLPAGKGLWPAFWMLPVAGEGEIDVMEHDGSQPTQVTGTLHGPGYSGDDGRSSEYHFPANQSAADFHVYAVDWTPWQISWSVDGHTYQTVRKTDVQPHPWVFDHPFYLVLNLAVGSDAVGYPDVDTPFPSEVVADYVRVYQSNSE
jgi:beta-glucanase (GH16 family)